MGHKRTIHKKGLAGIIVDMNKNGIYVKTDLKPKTYVLIKCIRLFLILLSFCIGALTIFGWFLHRIPFIDNSKIEYPLSSITGIAMNSKGHTYLRLEYFDRVQVYDEKGNFLFNWFCIESGKGHFNLQINEDDVVFIYISGDCRGSYTSKGKAVKLKDYPKYKAGKFDSERVQNGILYKDYGYAIDRASWLEKIVKVEKNGNMIDIISQPSYYWIICGPIPVTLWVYLFLFTMTAIKVCDIWTGDYDYSQETPEDGSVWCEDIKSFPKN